MCLGGIDPKYGFRDVERSLQAARSDDAARVGQGWLRPVFALARLWTGRRRAEPVPAGVPVRGA